METSNKLFVGNLNWQIRRQELKDHFGQWGEVAYATVSLDRETKRSRGFGFITFINEEDAIKAKEEATGKEFHDRELYIEYARPKPEDGELQQSESQEETQEAGEAQAEEQQEELQSEEVEQTEEETQEQTEEEETEETQEETEAEQE